MGNQMYHISSKANFPELIVFPVISKIHCLKLLKCIYDTISEIKY